MISLSLHDVASDVAAKVMMEVTTAAGSTDEADAEKSRSRRGRL